MNANQSVVAASPPTSPGIRTTVAPTSCREHAGEPVVVVAGDDHDLHAARLQRRGELVAVRGRRGDARPILDVPDRVDPEPVDEVGHALVVVDDRLALQRGARRQPARRAAR